ncbi:sulfide/dihydroorotate dehydrogenase-like FAD/NAD-binding protein [Desulforhabdus amnigena]|jgi:ferredoxin--NADP+ reductase|uniref:Ferredoxin-NADP+ reductase subunit alpha n=1 Tax=Desulforhabdus amnigena TaxID=40218 RepID=A0A9W6D1Q7_9BACT|nr:sulfide/dihydroorotate dehydrogenase-like FAD/NAD-binding protein [Desulforhabdus amnigena]NLJ29016.1 sulfide/dihydroorotate dehydrogenase-like FAD/NAD-binding protein [Deltaproteobacteria bacterium]GLI33673.1 ferredoxin-NADP+ reductase subunit alpha [Desulforhabdus amnigena]
MFPIVAHEELAPKVHRMSVKAPIVAEKSKPGQFVILIVDEKGERVPFTISGWDASKGTVDFVYIEVGKTTCRLGSLKPGDQLAHFVGPLGKPAEIDHYGHVLAVASGYGASAILPVLKALKEKENRITTILQAPDRERAFGCAELEEVSDRLVLAIGTPGEDMTVSATRLLRKLLANHPQNPIHRVIVMGSLCLMRVISEMTRPYAIKTMVHLTPLMVDGTGMCGACRLSVKGNNRFACVHGPEFDGHEVDGWDVLMARRCTYADESVLQQSFQCRGCSQW